MIKQNKKVGIITLNGNPNYGNRLQNYALQEVLKDFGFDVFTIDVKNNKYYKKPFVKKIYDSSIPHILSLSRNFIFKKIYKKNLQKRKINFVKFNENYICFSEFVLDESNFNDKYLSNYDYFIVGSDQVWNPNYTLCSPHYFLTFTSPNKRIAYAASFGISKLNPDYYDIYREYLMGFSYISVREEAGSEIVKNLINKGVPVVLDPTLLLPKEKWENIIADLQAPKPNYILTYFLGNMTKQKKKIVSYISKKYNLRVINLQNIKDEYYQICPLQFINLVSHSSIFLTDSFHGSVFSIIFEKPFIVFERESHLGSMFSRIDTLLLKFNLESRKYTNINRDENLIECDFRHAIQILNMERKKSIDYLVRALNIE